jgi:hypothetical protein
MKEQVARDVALVRAIEIDDRKFEVLSEDDRMYASRSAKELAAWQAADSKSAVTPDHFLQQRAEQILKRLSERMPPFAGYLRRPSAWPMVSIGVPLVALLVGAGVDRIGDPHRVDLLSAPLLGIIGWNLLVYVLLLASLFIPTQNSGWIGARMMRYLSAGRAAMPRKLPAILVGALIHFMTEWTRLSAKLTHARLARTLHLAAALFALGAVLSLLARGLLTQYVAGWESTFLDAPQVHALLSMLFTPAEWTFHLPGFSAADIEALRFAPTAAPSTALSPDAGKRWVLLYAATMLLLVMLPRMLLAAVAHWRARRLAANFPLDLDQPYFRQLGGHIGAAAGVLRVLPYSFTIDEARDRGLAQVAVMLLGEQARLMLRPSSAYGDEPVAALGDTPLDDPAVTSTAVLFNLAATPEAENHGAFIAHLVAAAPRGLMVLLDESALLERFGAQAGSAERINERITLWQRFCEHHHASATIVNLLDPSARPLDQGAA